MGKRILLLVMILPGVASALSWQPEPTESLKARMVEYARLNGHSEFAEKIAAETDLEAWIGETIEYAEAGLKTCRGSDYRDPYRTSLLRLIDYPIHVDTRSTNTPQRIVEKWREVMSDQITRARHRFLAEVKAAKIGEGELGIFHFYNMAYVLKGPRHAIAVDVTDRMSEWTDEEYRELAEMTDAFVLTHPHRDHFSRRILAPFLAAGKPIILPCDLGLSNECCRVFSDNHEEPVEVAGITIRNFMGNQGVPCNVYQLNIDGVSVVDPGDNDDYNVYTNLVRGAAADVIISPVWNFPSNILNACMANAGFNRNAALYLPAHFNELGHGVKNRESYWEAYWRDDRLCTPGLNMPRTLILYLGESVIWKRDFKDEPLCRGLLKGKSGW